jgi:hypothetical protein
MKKGSSDDKWLGKVVKAGTISDKLAAMTLMIQENPILKIGKYNI